MKKIQALQKLQQPSKKLFLLSDIKKLLRIEKDSYAYIFAGRLVQEGVIARAYKGVYYLTSNRPVDFELANFLYRPSCISLLSALHYYGILIQAPQVIVSVTPQKTKTIKTLDKEFFYAHLNKKYFSHYQMQNGFLISAPEKALIDTLFLQA